MPSSTQAYKDLQDAITQSNQYTPVSSQDVMKELSSRVGNFGDQNRAIADTTAKIFASPFNDLSNLSDQYGTGGSSTLNPLDKLKIVGNNLGNLYGTQDFQNSMLKQQQGGLNDILQSIMGLYQTQGQGAQQKVSNAQNLYTLSKQAEDSAAARAGQSTNIQGILQLLQQQKDQQTKQNGLTDIGNFAGGSLNDAYNINTAQQTLGKILPFGGTVGYGNGINSLNDINLADLYNSVMQGYKPGGTGQTATLNDPAYQQLATSLRSQGWNF